MLDYLIKNGTVIDGTGSKATQSDIGISEGKILFLGHGCGDSACEFIDASGYFVTPGFIDIHRHADAAVFRRDFGIAEVCQGITTTINGNCGLSLAPTGDSYQKDIMRYLEPVVGSVPETASTGTLFDYFGTVPKTRIHFGMLAGSGTIRANVCGYQKLHPEKDDFKIIHNQIERSLSEGAYGISLGLGYAPECFYTTEELIHALEPLRNSSVPVTVHIRKEGDGVLESVNEMIRIAEELNCHVHISHLKAMGKRNWGEKIPKVLLAIDKAVSDGVNIDFDAYPYTAGSTQLIHILPQEFLEGGAEKISERLCDENERRLLSARISSGEGFDNIASLAGWNGIYITSLHQKENMRYLGKSISEIAGMMNTFPVEACCKLLISEKCNVTMIDFMASKEDITAIYRHPLSNVISDSTYPTDGLMHPRVYGTFTHFLEEFVRKDNALTVENAVYKMSGRPSEVLNIKNKGLIRCGYDADLCIFKLDRIHENATYESPCVCSEGMEYVFVNGIPVINNGQLTDEKPGCVMKR